MAHVIWPKKTPMSNFHLLCMFSCSRVCFVGIPVFPWMLMCSRVGFVFSVLLPKIRPKKKFLKNWIFDTLFGLKKHPCQILIYYAKKVFVSLELKAYMDLMTLVHVSCQKFGQKKSVFEKFPNFVTRYLA